MLFNSVEFIFFFLPLVFLVFWSIRNQQGRFLFLTIAGYVFYGYWDYRFCALMMTTTVLDFFLGLAIGTAKTQHGKRILLGISVLANLAFLGFFKYCDFFLSSVNAVAAGIGMEEQIPLLHIILPVGISFYTFQSLSYTIDVYRGIAKPTRSFLLYSCFVSMFPQLVAGPIVRYAHVEDQLNNFPANPTFENVANGFWFFTVGLVKKILIADSIARVSDPLLNHYSSLGVLGSWAAMLGYTAQIYFDFSAYSDMAVGLASMFSIRLVQNFNSPYKAVNISDFWRRWHISLSTWLRDYLFIPLGGSRRGNFITLRNLVIVMFLGGLWHGAAWVFVLWGLYHGMLLVGHSVFKQLGWTPKSPAVNRVITFMAVVFGWVLFRSTDLHMAQTLMANMVGLGNLESWSELHALLGMRYPTMLVFSLCWTFFAPNSWEFRPQFNVRTALISGGTFAACVLLLAQKSPFLYFQF